MPATRTVVGTAVLIAALAASGTLASSADAIELVRQPIAVYGREAGQPIYFVNRPVLLWGLPPLQIASISTCTEPAATRPR